MSYGPEVNRLSVLWSAQPTSSCFAALAEALRKRGALEQATAVAAAGVTSRPEYLPGRVVMARIYADQGEWQSADAELRAAMALDPTHPLVVESLAAIAPHLAGPPSEAPSAPEIELPAPYIDAPVTAIERSSYVPAEAIDHEAEESIDYPPGPHSEDELPEPEPVLTESLAMLYRGQGHLEEAVGVLDALVARAPENSDLVARRDAVRAEMRDARPLPFDASESGGRPVREWLSALATSRSTPAPPSSGFDAFYQAPGSSHSEEGDLEAFQAWLRELDR